MPAATAHDEIRILFVTGGRRIGGMETHLIALASNLPPSVRSCVCCLNASDAYAAQLSEAGIAHVSLACPSLVGPGGLLAYLRFERLIRRFQPDVVHSYGFVADVLAGMLRARGSRVRIITSRRGEDRSTRHQAIRRLVNRVSDRVVCVSSETAIFVSSTESPPPSKLAVIPNGVQLGGTNGSRARGPDEPLRFGTLGTVKPIKGTDLLVDAFMKLDAGLRVELVIAGLIDRPWAEALRDRAQPDPRIRFAGRSDDANGFLGGIDVFVLPSRSEGMSNALLEAMAAGLPCIATDVGSNRSLLNPTAEPPAGVICEPTADALFRAMAEMIANADARRRYGVRAGELARERYTVPGMVEQYERLYRSVVGRPSAQPRAVPTGCATD